MVEQIREGFIEKEVKKICDKNSHEQQEDMMEDSSMGIQMDDGETLPVIVTPSQTHRPHFSDSSNERRVQLYGQQDDCTPDKVA